MNFSQWFDVSDSGNTLLVTVALVLLVTLTASIVWRVVNKRLFKLVSKTTTQIDDLVLESINLPIHWMIWLFGASWLLDASAAHLAAQDIENVSIARQIGLVLLFAWALWRLVTRLEAHQLQSGRDATTIQLIGRLAKFSVFILVLMPIFQLFGISISGILAFGGVGGLVVGMAAKDLLANIFGYLIIYMDKPFKVGDWVRSPDRSIEGVVEHIGLRVTCIRTFDKRPLYVPNAVFTTISVENPSRMSNRRIYETIGVRYEDAHLVKELMNRIRSMLETHPDIDQDQALIVHFNAFGASSLDFFIYTLTKTTDWFEYHKVKEDVLLKIMDIIHDTGADCAFPTRTLKLEGLPEGFKP